MTAPDGRQDFDFIFGRWHVANRKRVDPLDDHDRSWVEFDAVVDARPVLAGLGNVDTFSAPAFPGRPGFEGFTLRRFDPAGGLWRIWWSSTSGGGELDPPVVGRFADGCGRFEGYDVMQGRAVKVRFDWKAISATAARWEQAFSFDDGTSWMTNWTMQLTRANGAGAS